MIEDVLGQGKLAHVRWVAAQVLHSPPPKCEADRVLLQQHDPATTRFYPLALRLYPLPARNPNTAPIVVGFDQVERLISEIELSQPWEHIETA